MAAVRSVCTELSSSRPESVFAVIAELIKQADAQRPAHEAGSAPSLLAQQPESAGGSGSQQGKSEPCWVVGTPGSSPAACTRAGDASLASFAPPLKRASAKATAGAAKAAAVPGRGAAGKKKLPAKPDSEKRAEGSSRTARGGAFGSSLAAVQTLAEEYGRLGDSAQGGASASTLPASGGGADDEDDGADENAGSGADEEEEDGGGAGGQGRSGAGGWEAEVWALLKKKAGLDKLLRAKPSTAEFGNW